MPRLVAGDDRHVPATFQKAESAAGEFLLVGTVMRPEVFDAHEDIIAADALRYAAHDFVADYGKSTSVGLQHDPDQEPDADLVESFVAEADGTSYGYAYLKDDWVMVIRVNDEDLQKQCSDGTFNAFSPEGSARVQYLDETAFEKAEGVKPKRRKKRYLSMQVSKVDIVDKGANRLDYVTILKRHDMDPDTDPTTDPTPSETQPVPDPPSVDPVPEPVTKSEDPPQNPTPDLPSVDPKIDPEPEANAKVPVRKERRMTQGRRDEIRAVASDARELGTKIVTLAERLETMLAEVEQMAADATDDVGDGVVSDSNTSTTPGYEEVSKRLEQTIEARFSEFGKKLGEAADATKAAEAKIAARDAEIQDLRKRLSDAETPRPASSRVDGTTVPVQKQDQADSVFSGLV